MTKIIQKEDPLLREHAKAVPSSDIQNPKFQKILLSMKKALDGEEDGVAIAAPQIGISLRIFLISQKISKILEASEKKKYSDLPTVYINPKIIKRSKDRKLMEEGCLSVRYLYGKIRRSTKVTIEAIDENGKKFQRGASGLLAQIYQHETDHLDGILFIDTARDIKDLPPEK